MKKLIPFGLLLIIIFACGGKGDTAGSDGTHSNLDSAKVDIEIIVKTSELKPSTGNGPRDTVTIGDNYIKLVSGTTVSDFGKDHKNFTVYVSPNTSVEWTARPLNPDLGHSVRILKIRSKKPDGKQVLTEKQLPPKGNGNANKLSGSVKPTGEVREGDEQDYLIMLLVKNDATGKPVYKIDPKLRVKEDKVGN